jgi:probable HAF family extracellular repeat protein
MMKRLPFFFAALVSTLLSALLAAPMHAGAAPLYTLTVIGGPGGAGSGLNSAGQVVGTMAAGADYRAFFYDGVTVADLGTLGGATSSALGLNDSGTVVGWSDVADGTRQAFVYANGAMSGLAIAGPSDASDINNSGVIAGTFTATNGSGDVAPQAYTWANGVLTQLGPALADNQGAGERDFGHAINNAGMVVGTAAVNASPDFPSQPFLYSNGVMQDLGDFGGIISDAWGINDLGQVVGGAGVALSDTQLNVYGQHAFFYSDGTLHDLGTLNDRFDSAAFDINNLGQIVGVAATRDGSRAALFADGGITLLDTLLDPAGGWTMTTASAINDHGQIAGTACQLGLCYAVRLDIAPVPEPGQGALLLAGLLAMGRMRSVFQAGFFNHTWRS